MKNRTRVLCGVLLVVIFYACKKKTDVTPQIAVNRAAISLGAFVGYTDSFEVQSNTGWELQLPASAAQWMAVSTTRGNAGKTNVKVSTTAVNTQTQTAAISVKPAGRETPSVEVAVTQKIYVVDWKKMIGSARIDDVKSIARTPDGGWVLAGSTLSDGSGDFPASSGYYDAFVMKLNATGTITWNRRFGGNAGDFFNSVAVTPEGGFIACGTTESSLSGNIPVSHGSFDVVVVKLGVDGTQEWIKLYGGTGPERGHSVAVTPDGGYVIAGETSSNNTGDVGPTNGGADAWVLKLDPTGNIVWKKALGGSAYERAMCVASNAEGKIVVAGNSFSSNSGHVGTSHGDSDGWVLNLDATGNIIWNKLFGGADFEDLYSVAPTPDNGYVLAGYTYSNNSGDVGANKGQGDAWILKLEASGNLVWSKTYGGNNLDLANGVAVTPEGELLMAGFSQSNNNGDVGPTRGATDLWLLKLKSTGGKILSKTMGGNDGDNGIAISLSTNGEFIIAGTTNTDNNGDVGLSHGAQDIWLLKFK